MVFTISSVSTPHLFDPDAVFVSNQTNQNDVFKEVYTDLLTIGAVKEAFLPHLVEREANYPTGIDTSPISDRLPNVAIPHTEGEFVKTRLIVPVALKTPVVFHNMIDPNQELQVKFLFMILNNDPEGQANLLAQIMDFLAQTPVADLEKLFNFSDPADIYQFLAERFKQK